MNAISEPTRLCPSCGVCLHPEAVLCVKCGYHLEKGVHLAQVSGWAVPPPVDRSNPYAPPAGVSSAGPSSISEDLLANLWIHGRIPRWKWWAINVMMFVLRMGMAGMHEAEVVPTAVVFVVAAGALWITLMAQIRRWHDLGQSGFWCLINFVPCVGPIYAFVMLGFFAGTDGPNEYGDDPLKLVQPEDDKARWGA